MGAVVDAPDYTSLTTLFAWLACFDAGAHKSEKNTFLILIRLPLQLLPVLCNLLFSLTGFSRREFEDGSDFPRTILKGGRL